MNGRGCLSHVIWHVMPDPTCNGSVSIALHE